MTATRDKEQGDLAPSLRELAECVERAVPPGESQCRIGPLWALRETKPTIPLPALYTPMLCVIAQGSKQILLGDERYVYDTGRFLLNSIAVPAAGGVLEATPLRPCLWVMVELDPALVASVVVEAGLSRPIPSAPLRTMEASPIDRPTLDAVVRLARLFDSPGDAGFLVPLALREVIYRLLTGDQAPRLHQIASQGSGTNRVVRAIEWLRDNYTKPLAIDTLARESGMSASALHHHFKDVTAMSPLQFQKQLRLQEAKRLMMGEGLDAASAGIRVGYEDPSYFSREYRRFFGDPPRRHVMRTRNEVA